MTHSTECERSPRNGTDSEQKESDEEQQMEDDGGETTDSDDVHEDEEYEEEDATPEVISFSSYAKTITLTTRVCTYDKAYNPIGIVMAPPNGRVLKVYAHDNGDMFRCNEPNNEIAKKILSATTEHKRNKTNVQSNVRGSKPSLKSVIASYQFDLKVQFPMLEDPKLTKRLMDSVHKIMAAFNTDRGPEDNIGNIELARIGYIFASIRLGVKGYRFNVDEFGAALTSANKYISTISKFKFQHMSYTQTTMVVYNLLKGHFYHMKQLKLADPPSPDAEVPIDEDPTNKVMTTKNKSKTWIIESRPQVIESLNTIRAYYTEHERDEIKQKRWIANEQADPAGDKRKNQGQQKGKPAKRNSWGKPIP